MILRVGFAKLQPALAEVELGVDHYAVELGDANRAGTKHLLVKFDGIGGPGDGQKRGEAGETVWHTVGGEAAVCSSGGCDFW